MTTVTLLNNDYIKGNEEEGFFIELPDGFFFESETVEEAYESLTVYYQDTKERLRDIEHVVLESFGAEAELDIIANA